MIGDRTDVRMRRDEGGEGGKGCAGEGYVRARESLGGGPLDAVTR